jgi:transcriptional regulator with GAF, ATPase, and Fis domain
MSWNGPWSPAEGRRSEIVDEPAAPAIVPATPDPGPASRSTLAQLEQDHIVATLERLSWRVEGAGGAAEEFGINASTLRTHMRKHGIRRPAKYRPPARPAGVHIYLIREW